MYYFNQKPQTKSLRWLKFILIILITSTVFISCNNEVEEEFNNVENINNEGWFNKDSYKEKDKLGAKLARNLAKAMEYPEVRKFLKEETAGKEDGLNATIFRFSQDKQISYTNNESQRVVRTLGQIISNPTRANQNERKANDFLDSLNKLYPNLHIAIPDTDGNLAENWNADVPLKVAYVPDKFGYEIESIQAFDMDGNEFTLDPLSNPKELIVAVGPNYKITPIPNEEISNLNQGSNNNRMRICPLLIEPVHQDEQFTYYDSQQLSDCQYQDPLPGGGGTTDPDDDDDGYSDPNACAADANRWTDNTEEYLTQFRYPNIAVFRDVNGVLGDTKPIELTIVWGELDTESSMAEKKVYYLTRNQLRNYSVFGSTTKWYKANTRIRVWDYKNEGDTYMYDWNARGTGNETTRGISFTTGFEASLIEILSLDQELEISHEVKVTDSDRYLGRSSVDYCHESTTEFLYDTGNSIEFKVKQGPID